MTEILERRESESLWGRFCNWITSTENPSGTSEDQNQDNDMVTTFASRSHSLSVPFLL
jgi:hypothetical protein